MAGESTTKENLLQEKADVFHCFSHIISKLIFYMGKITVYEKDPCEIVCRVLFIFLLFLLHSWGKNTLSSQNKMGHLKATERK